MTLAAIALWSRSRPVVPAAGRRADALSERIAELRRELGTASPITVDQLPIVQGLANLHADMVSQFPLNAVEEATGALITDQFAVLVQPDPTEPLGETLHKIVQSMWYTGNAFGLTTGDAIRIQNPNSCSVQPSFDGLDDLRIEWFYIHGEQVPVEQIVLWKINDDPRRGPLGASPLARCWQAVENYAWAYRYLADYYTSGGNPSLILRSRNATDPQQAEELWLLWLTARRAGRPAVLPYDVEVEESPAPTDISDTVAVLGFCAAEICRATNTPPSLGNAPVAAALTYATTLDELRRWLALSFGPTWLARIERGFTSLLPEGVCARFDTSDLPRLSSLAPEPGPVPLTAVAPGTGAPQLRIAN